MIESWWGWDFPYKSRAALGPTQCFRTVGIRSSLGVKWPGFGISHTFVSSKGLPRQAEVAQGVPDRLRPRIFLTFWHYKGGKSSAKRTGRLYPRRNPWYSLSEAESTSGHMVLSGVPRKKSPVTSSGINSGTFQLVAQCLNHYATPGLHLYLVLRLKKE